MYSHSFYCPIFYANKNNLNLFSEIEEIQLEKIINSQIYTIWSDATYFF